MAAHSMKLTQHAEETALAHLTDGGHRAASRLCGPILLHSIALQRVLLECLGQTAALQHRKRQ